MKYKELKQIQNPYPSVDNYKKIANRIILFGKFDDNTIDFEIQTIDDIKYVKNTNFRFIIAFSKHPDSNENFSEKRHYYTSESYYNDLQKAINENNPYFTINNSIIISVYTDELVQIMKKQLDNEEAWNVKINNNIGITLDGDNINQYNIDYNKLVKYINWLIEKPTSYDTELLPVSVISDISTELNEEEDE